jgi:hypothetical protein
MDSIMKEPSDYEKDRLSAMAKYSDSVYQLETLKANGQFYMNVMNLFLVLIVVVLLYNLGLFTPYLLYLTLFLISTFGVIYIIGMVHFNNYFRDRTVYHEQRFNA